MAAPDPSGELTTEELTAILREVRERVRARHPQPGDSASHRLPLADLMPLLHARDAAEAKVASIGAVNPRRGGALNAVIQGLKKLAARALDWHVREQVVFNREMIACVNATVEALNEVNRAIAGAEAAAAGLEAEARELRDIRDHWAAWRAEWERKLSQNEVQFLRAVADLQGAFQHRSTLMESNFRDIVKAQHADFEGALERSGLDIQKRLWADLERIRREYEAIIHRELRMVRQRAAAFAPAGGETPPPAAVPGGPRMDYAWFAERFRGPEDSVGRKQRFYLPYFQGRKNVLDIGCGRGEFLELMREAGVPARGIDLGEGSVSACRQKELAAEKADLFEYLDGLPEASLDGIFCAQVAEHLAPERLPEMVRLAASRLERGGVLAIETPNPGCLAIFAAHFYLDPTHTRPVPHPLLAFYMEEYGMGSLEVHELSPAVETLPGLAGLPEDFREAFFGGLDYAIIGIRL